MGRVLGWGIYLALVGLAGWLVFVVVKWGYALDAGLALILGIPALMLALFLFYFMLFFGFFTFVAEMPM